MAFLTKHLMTLVFDLGFVLLNLGLMGGFFTYLENLNLLEDFSEDLIDIGKF